MTEKTVFHTDVSKMRLNEGRVSQAIFNSGQGLCMIFNKEVVFNRAEYYLRVEEKAEIDPPGTKDQTLADYIGVESYKIDYDGTRSEVSFRGGSDKIAPNNTTEPKTGEYTIIQEMSALQISGKWTQAGKAFMHYSFKQIRSIDVDYDEAYAGGGKVEPYVTINVWLLEHWSDESTVDKYVSYRGAVSSATGKVITDNAVGSYSSIDKSTGVVSVPSLRTTERAARDVFTVETLGGTVTIPEVENGKVVSWSWNEGLNVSQQENVRYTDNLGYDISVSANPATGIGNSGGSSAISARAKQNVRYTWDSGATPVDDTINLYGVLSTNLGSLRATSVDGELSTYLDLGENLSYGRKATVSITVGSTVKSCTVEQNEASYELEAGEDKECNATASTVYATFKSSRNGKVWEPDFTTNLDGATIDKTQISLSGFIYTVPVSIPENKAYEARNIVVTATQSRHTGAATANVTIIQAAAAAVVERKISAKGTWNAAYTAVVGITATLYNNSSSSVTFSGIKVELRRNEEYKPEESELVGTPKSYDGEVTVAANSSKAISISNITHTMDKSYYYWLAAYATQTTETVYEEIEQEAPEG